MAPLFPLQMFFLQMWPECSSVISADFPSIMKVVSRLWVDLLNVLNLLFVSGCRCFAGVHPGVGLLHGLHGRADQRSAAGRGRGPTQTQRHPLSLLPPGGRAAITAGRGIGLLQSASDRWRTFNRDPLDRSAKALVKPRSTRVTHI